MMAVYCGVMIFHWGINMDNKSRESFEKQNQKKEERKKEIEQENIGLYEKCKFLDEKLSNAEYIIFKFSSNSMTKEQLKNTIKEVDKIICEVYKGIIGKEIAK